MVPFVTPPPVATPASKSIAVAAPNGVSTPVLSATVGVLPPGLAEAPEKTTLFSPW
jgi:hypothetical protein